MSDDLDEFENLLVPDRSHRSAKISRSSSKNYQKSKATGLGRLVTSPKWLRQLRSIRGYAGRKEKS